MSGFVGTDPIRLTVQLVESRNWCTIFETSEKAVEFITKNFPEFKQDNDNPDVFLFESDTEVMRLEIFY